MDVDASVCLPAACVHCTYLSHVIGKRAGARGGVTVEAAIPTLPVLPSCPFLPAPPAALCFVAPAVDDAVVLLSRRAHSEIPTNPCCLTF